MKYPAYPAYKPSGVEWLGDVPEHWELKRLKYSVSINDDALPETTAPDFEFRYVDISSVDSVAGITSVEELVFEDAPSRARRVVCDGDTIVSTVRTYLRAIAALREPVDGLVVSTGFAVIRPRRIEPDFLGYALKESGFVETIVARSVGVSYPAVNASDVATIPISLPPVHEQGAIAGFLDAETAKIDTLVAKKRELIEKLKEKRAALISRTVTRGLPPEAARAAGLAPNPKLKPSGIEWIGDVPEHWEVKRLKHVSSMRAGNGITTEALEDEGPYPVYGGNGLRGFAPAFTHEGDHVLVGRQGALCGNVNYAAGRFWASEHAVVVTPFADTEVRWLGELLRSMDLNKCSIAAAQPGLAIDTISDLTIARPPYNEQCAIADFLDTETAKIDQMSAKVEAAIERLQEYRTALITAAVTGKIDVRRALREGTTENTEHTEIRKSDEEGRGI